MLGQLGEAERDSEEERLFGERGVRGMAEAVEAELMDPYVAGELRGVETTQRESYMSAHPAARTQLALAQGLERHFGVGRKSAGSADSIRV